MAGSSPSSKTSRSLRRRSVQGYMLQLILDAGSHLHQLVAMQQQLPQVALLRTRHPDGREPARRQQLQQMIGVALVVLLFADRGRANAGRVADDQLMSPALQQALEPAGIAAGLDAHAHPLPLQAAVELLRCARGMMEFLLHSLFRLHIQHGNLLEARMKITAYNLHCGSFRPSPWSFANSRLLGAAWSRRCYQIKRSEGSAVRHKMQIPRFARDDKLCKVSLQLSRQLFVLRSRRFNESAEDRLRGLGQLRPIVHTPRRMPLHR